MLVSVEVQEEVLDLLDDLFDPGVGSVDLVDDQDDGQSLLERLSKDEPSLGQGTLGRVDEKNDRVDHREAPFDLAAEVGVTRRVDDVDGEVVPFDAVFFARIVMPFSRSKSPESITRSVNSSWAVKEPV